MSDQWVRWGTWPARLAGAGLVLYGAYLIIGALISLGAQAAPTDDPLLNIGYYLQMITGGVVIIVGGLVALLAWLTRRPKRAAAISGIVGCFFVAGLLVAYALAAGLGGMLLAGALIAGAGLLIAGGTAVAGRKSFDGEVTVRG